MLAESKDLAGYRSVELRRTSQRKANCDLDYGESTFSRYGKNYHIRCLSLYCPSNALTPHSRLPAIYNDHFIFRKIVSSLTIISTSKKEGLCRRCRVNGEFVRSTSVCFRVVGYRGECGTLGFLNKRYD
ncbi:hypothetical protein PM082_013339 [Marasmius tenuissimus]|nr:hypothetical protein PM082_013339 [Marasmius tenuissimus]